MLLWKGACNRQWLELAGWLVFTASSCGFLVSTYMARDIFAFAGSLLFLLGCLLFTVPLAARLLARVFRAGVFRAAGKGHGPLPLHEACNESQCHDSEREP